MFFDFATVVEIIQNIITCKGLREFSIQSHDQNNKKMNTIKISVIKNFKQTTKNAPDKTWIHALLRFQGLAKIDKKQMRIEVSTL